MPDNATPFCFTHPRGQMELSFRRHAMTCQLPVMIKLWDEVPRFHMVKQRAYLPIKCILWSAKYCDQTTDCCVATAVEFLDSRYNSTSKENTFA